MPIKSFLSLFSVWSLAPLEMVRVSSLQRPKRTGEFFLTVFRIHNPIKLHTLALSQAPIAMSVELVRLDCLTHAEPLLNSTVFLACIIIYISLSLTLVKTPDERKCFVCSPLYIDGQKINYIKVGEPCPSSTLVDVKPCSRWCCTTNKDWWPFLWHC